MSVIQKTGFLLTGLIGNIRDTDQPLYEPRCEKTGLWGFIHQAEQPQKISGGLKN